MSTINRNHVLTALKAGVQAIVLAGAKGYLAQVRRIDDDTVIAQARHELEDQAIENAIASAMQEHGISAGPETPASIQEARFKRLEDAINNLTEQVEDLSGQLVTYQKVVSDFVADTVDLDEPVAEEPKTEPEAETPPAPKKGKKN
jgi:coenzyme F420-reducing hydrogenase delta subunit